MSGAHQSRARSVNAIATQEFPYARRGYDPVAVRSFLTELADELADAHAAAASSAAPSPVPLALTAGNGPVLTTDAAGIVLGADLRRQLSDIRVRPRPEDADGTDPRVADLPASLGVAVARILRAAHEEAAAVAGRAREAGPAALPTSNEAAVPDAAVVVAPRTVVRLHPDDLGPDGGAGAEQAELTRLRGEVAAARAQIEVLRNLVGGALEGIA